MLIELGWKVRIMCNLLIRGRGSGDGGRGGWGGSGRFVGGGKFLEGRNALIGSGGELGLGRSRRFLRRGGLGESILVERLRLLWRGRMYGDECRRIGLLRG